MTQEQNKYYYYLVELPSGRKYTYRSEILYSAGDTVLVGTSNNYLPLKGIIIQGQLDSWPNTREIISKYPENGCPYAISYRGNECRSCIITSKICTHPYPVCAYWGAKNVKST